MAETDTVKAAIYSRVSSEDQAAPDKVSLAEQREKAEAYCKAQGWDVAEVYEDAGVSGARSDRPDLNRLLADAHEGKFQRVVFLKLDRLGRKTKDLLMLSERLDDLGVGIVSVQDSFDTGTPSGRLYFTILGAVAEFEREQIRERTVMGRRAAAKQGRYNTGAAPFGYDYNPETHKLVVNEGEAAVVRRIYGMYIRQRLSHSRIARLLVDEGIPTRASKKGWHITQISRILKNPIYCGRGFYGKTLNTIDRYGKRKTERRPTDQWIPVDCPAIVTEKEVSEAQARAKRNKRESQRPRDDENPYLLSGIIRCEPCGRAIVSYTQRWRRRGKKYTYRHYFCAGQHNYGTKCRSPERIRAERVEEAVMGLIVETFSDAEKVLELCRDYSQRVEAEINDQSGAVADLHRKLEGVEGERGRLVAALGKGLISEADLAAALKRLEGEAERWTAELARMEETVRQREKIEELERSAYAIAENIEAITETMNLATRKQLVRTLVEQVRLTGDNQVIVEFAIGGIPSQIGGRRTPVT